MRAGLELNRNLADELGHIGAAKILLGQAEETEARVREALRLSPHDTFVYGWCMYAGWAKSTLAERRRRSRRSIEANGNYPTSHFYLAAALSPLGRLAEAWSEAEAGLAIDPSFTISRIRAFASGANPEGVAGREQYTDGLRKAGVP
jgi:hypothetical protein